MDGCKCYVTPESTWTTHYGAVEPGSTMEWNPDCPVHPRNSRIAAELRSAAIQELLELPE